MRRIMTRLTLIPTSRKRSSGRPVDRPSSLDPARVLVVGAVVRGVAVAPSTPPDDPVGVGVATGVGVTSAVGVATGVGVAVGVVVGLGDKLGVGLELGEALGVGVTLGVGVGLGVVVGVGEALGLGDVLGLGEGDGQGGTVIRWMIDPSENVIR